MADGVNPTELAASAADPTTDGETLRQIAYYHPELRAVVAANPAAYDGLVQWLGQLGDPAVNAAVAARGSAVPTSSTAPTQAWPGPLNASATSGTPQWSPDPTTTARSTWAPDAVLGARDGATTSGAQSPWAASSATTPLPASAPSWNTPTWAGNTPTGAGNVAGAAAGTGGVRAEKSTTPIVLALLVVVLAVLVVVLSAALTHGFGLLRSTTTAGTGVNPSAGATPLATPAASASPRDTVPTTSSEGASTPSAPSDAPYPVQSGAKSWTAFLTPSGNILCDMEGSDQVACEIGTHDWANQPSASCPEGIASGMIITASDNAESCMELEDATIQGTLDYGQSTTNGTFACTSTADGVTCWNTRTGASFAISKAGWMTGTTGEISPRDFTWNK